MEEKLKEWWNRSTPKKLKKISLFSIDIYLLFLYFAVNNSTGYWKIINAFIINLLLVALLAFAFAVSFKEDNYKEDLEEDQPKDKSN